MIGRRGKDGAPCTEAREEGSRRENPQAHGSGGGMQHRMGLAQACPFS